MAEPQVSFYDVRTGWSTTPDPFPNSCGDAELKAGGFSLFARAGVEGGFQVSVYSGARYVVFVDSFDSHVETIVAPDFPSMVELVNKLSPMALASQVQSLQDVATDLQELLIRDGGPLQDAYEARWRRERAQAEAIKSGPKKG